MNDTADYRMNPAEDTLVYGDELEEGMWALPADPSLRRPHEDDEDSRLRRQRFRRVTRLRRHPGSGAAPAVIVFVGEWVDGYQETHTYAVTYAWIVKKAPAPEVSATVTKGDIIRIVPEKGPERIMVVSHVEQHIITLADLPEESEGKP